MRLEGIEWDENKNAMNKAVHRISFETAQYIFFDKARLERFDQSIDNTSGEERWQTIGRVQDTLFVVYTERGINKRIISARKADKKERRFYYENSNAEGWSRAD